MPEDFHFEPYFHELYENTLCKITNFLKQQDILPKLLNQFVFVFYKTCTPCLPIDLGWVYSTDSMGISHMSNLTQSEKLNTLNVAQFFSTLVSTHKYSNQLFLIILKAM